MEISKITLKELEVRKNWSLNQKIDHSLYIIDSFIAQFPNCIFSYSGGVDSTILLHLTRMIDKGRKGMFVNTTNEHSEIIKFVKQQDNIQIINPKITFSQVIERYGFPLISKEQARYLYEVRYSKSQFLINKRLDSSDKYSISAKYRFLMDASFDIQSKCCDYLKKNPMKPFTKDGNILGLTAFESKMRTFQYLKNGCINLGAKKANPLSIWTREDEWKFIKQNKIPYCKIYDKGETHTGCAYCGFGLQFDPTRFYRLKKREPKRYDIMMHLMNNGVTFYEAIRVSNHQTQQGFFDMF